MRVELARIDAFTGRPFKGNPAAVCLLDRPRDREWYQAIAREMSAPATAFLLAHETGFDLRWFSPATELALCGHGTLAAAHFLWENGHLASDEPARFQTPSGLLTAVRRGDWIELDLPAEPASEVDSPPELLESLGVVTVFVGRNRLDYLVELQSEAAVRAVQPDLRRLRAVPTRGVIVTSRAESAGFDFVSRFFAPSAGIDEDPATGSAHCCLGPYWSERLGRSDLLGYQASTRGGVLRVGVRGDRVRIGGQAVMVVRGQLAVECEGVRVTGGPSTESASGYSGSGLASESELSTDSGTH